MPRATPSPDAHKFVHIDVDSFLRNLEQLTQGDDTQKEGEDGESANALLSAVERRLQGADSFDIDDIVQKLDEFENHDIISRILDQGHSDANALGITVTEHKREVEANLNKVEMASIEDYITESPNLIQLQHEIEDCDSMLAHIERLLSSFLGNLGSISEQITQLQSNSQELKLKLENRQAAEGLIGALLERLVVPDSLVNSVFAAPVDEAFVPVLEELMKRLEASESVQLEMPDTPALKEVKPVLEKLRVKAAERVRKAMMEQIYSLRQPRTNIQMKQANVLFKSAGMVTFLKKCGPEVYTEVRDAYVATLSRALSVGFRQYLSGIKSLHKEVATKDDVLGVKVGTGGEGGGVGMLSVLKGVRPRRKGGLYGLGNRVQVLLPERDDNGRPKERRGIIMAHVPRGQTFSYEWIFFSVQNFLVSTSISEYAFDLHLFKDAEVFSSIMHPILQFIEANLATEVDDLHDIVGVLLCLRVHHQNRLTLTKHAMPALEGYQDRVAMKLWERFQVLLERHSRSIRPPAEKVLFRAVLAPHRVAEDCSDLIVSLLQLNHEYSDSYIREAVERLARDLVQLLLRMAPMFRDSKQSTVFLIINYFAVLSRLQSGDRQVLATLPSTPPHSGRSSSERGGMGSIGTSILQEFTEHYARSARMYVDLALASHFRELMEFVSAADRALRSCEEGDAQLPGPLVERATGVIAQFRSQWEHDLSGLCEQVRSSFQAGGTDCARDILQRCLTQLMLTYQRAQDVLRAHGPGTEEVLRNAVPVQAVMYHIKQLDKSL